MKKLFSELLDGFFHKEHFTKRLFIVILAVITMGFSLSWLIQVDMGTDPCTMMNQAISGKLGLSLGNWQAIFNTILLILVVVFGGRNLGFGTLANMFLVGYSVDFFTFLLNRLIPHEIFMIPWVRILIFLPALALFVVAASVYMDIDMGTAPYDAIPFILSKKLSQIPFKVIRIGYDCTAILIGLLLGGKLRIVTILMALTLGPVITFVGKKLEKFL